MSDATGSTLLGCGVAWMLVFLQMTSVYSYTYFNFLVVITIVFIMNLNSGGSNFLFDCFVAKQDDNS